MRAAAENGTGKISVLTVNGDKARVIVIKEGHLDTNRRRARG
jgi:hypothetical protein